MLKVLTVITHKAEVNNDNERPVSKIFSPLVISKNLSLSDNIPSL